MAMHGTDQLMIDSCTVCHGLFVRMSGIGTLAVPGTDGTVRTCRESGQHGAIDNIGRTQAGRLIHIALTTIIRAHPGDSAIQVSLRDAAHCAQDWIKAQNVHRRIGIPLRLLDGYGVSSEGLACARMAARMLSESTRGLEATWWRAIGTMLRAAYCGPREG